MRFCLDQKKLGGYDYGVTTFYSDKHLGKDWEAVSKPLFAPEDGLIVRVATGASGGKTIWFKPVGKTIILRWLHLSEFLVKQGDYVKEGQKIAVTGNTGVSTKPHLHEDHWPKGVVTLKFVDTQNPDIYYSLSKTFMKITIVANKINWTTLPAKLEQLKQKFLADSSGKFEPVFDVKQTNFDNVPLSPFINNTKCVDINWYRTNITPLATGEATLLLLNPDQYPNGNTWGYMTYGDTNQPVRMEVMALENEGNVFVERAFHEICHALLFLSGQNDVSPVNPNDALVHYYLYQNPPQYKALMDYIDWSAVQRKLTTIKPLQKIKIRQVGWNVPDKEKGLYVPFDTLEHQALVLAKINEVLPSYELDNTKEYNLGKRPF